MGAFQASSGTVVAESATTLLQPCNLSTCPPSIAHKPRPLSLPAGVPETSACATHKGEVKLRFRRWRQLGRPGKRRLLRRRVKCCRGSRRSLRPQQVRLPAFEKRRRQPGNSAYTCHKSLPIRGILRTSSTKTRATADSRHPSWKTAWLPVPSFFRSEARCLQKLTRPRLTFDSTVQATEFARSLGDGVPSEGDIAIGLGKPLGTVHIPLKGAPKKRPQELPVVLAECRADLVKESIGPTHFAQAIEEHQQETAYIRQRRQESINEGEDIFFMPTSMEEARQRAFKVSQEVADAAEELVTPLKGGCEADQQHKLWRIEFVEDNSPQACISSVASH